MPWWVSESWLRSTGAPGGISETCPYRSCGCLLEANPQMFDLATYGEIDGEPGRYQLEWFS